MRKSKKELKREEIVQAACRLFASKGYYLTTIADIADDVGMSVGNMYNYFTSKEELAKYIIQFASRYLGERMRVINEAPLSVRDKIFSIVRLYLEAAVEKPELIDYFLRVYLANREVFSQGCQGLLCVGEFVTEVMILLEEGARSGELRNQEFFTAFSMMMGTLAGFVFLSGEEVLPRDLLSYSDEIADNIWRALKA